MQKIELIFSIIIKLYSEKGIYMILISALDIAILVGLILMCILDFFLIVIKLINDGFGGGAIFYLFCLICLLVLIILTCTEFPGQVN